MKILTHTALQRLVLERSPWQLKILSEIWTAKPSQQLVVNEKGVS
jgi:hypothetical protein